MPSLTDKEIDLYYRQLQSWKVVDKDGIKILERSFEFEDFAQALEFSNKVGVIAEEEGHHPVLVTEWGKVTVSWWTHKINGLHKNDFIMASKTDELLKQ